MLEAADGVEALELMTQNEGKVDIVVSDVVMPEMDGPALFKELRKRNPSRSHRRTQYAFPGAWAPRFPRRAFRPAFNQAPERRY